MTGILIAIEGIDGAGKTTQATRIADALVAAGVPVTCSKEPTGGKWGQSLRDSASTGRMDPEEELETFMRDRREHVETLIAPALERGDYVIVDRYYYSNAAYQGARGFDAGAIIASNEAFAPRPDFLLIFDAPVDVGLARVRMRGDKANLFEQHDQLDRAAAIFASFTGPHVAHVDAMQSIDAVTRESLLRLLDGPVFRALCKKEYQSNCEPAYCSVRIAGQCPFVDLNTRLAGVGAFGTPRGLAPLATSLPVTG